MLLLDLILVNLWCWIGGMILRRMDCPPVDTMFEELVVLLMWPLQVYAIMTGDKYENSGASGDSGVDLDRDSDHLH